MIAEWTPPPWLTAKVDQRVALLLEALNFEPEVRPAGANTAVTFLTEPDSDSPEDMVRWEWTCDGCGAYCPGNLHNGHMTRPKGDFQVVVTYGICCRCSGVHSHDT